MRRRLPALPIRCATTASRSGLPRRATRWRSSPRPPPRGRLAQAGAARAVLRHPFGLGEVRRDLRRRSGAAMACAATARCAARRPRAGAPLRRIARGGGRRTVRSGLPDHVERRGADDATQRRGRGRREGASRAENLATTDLRHIADPADVARAHALAARLARSMRARLVRREQVRRRGRRLDLRRTIHRNVSRMAARRSISRGAGARSSRCAWWCCSTPPAR